jgi:hypothetical protein
MEEILTDLLPGQGAGLSVCPRLSAYRVSDRGKSRIGR